MRSGNRPSGGRGGVGQRFTHIATLLLFSLGLAAISSAVPPVPPYRELGQIAERDGAGAVRGEFQGRVAALVSELDRPVEMPLSSEGFAQRLATVNWTLSYLHAWIHAEVRSLRASRQGNGDLSPEAMEPILAAVRQVTAEAQRLRAAEPALRAGLSAAALRRLRVDLDSLPSLDDARAAVADRVAALAWLVGGQGMATRAREAAAAPAARMAAAGRAPTAAELDALFGPVAVAPSPARSQYKGGMRVIWTTTTTATRTP